MPSTTAPGAPLSPGPRRNQQDPPSAVQSSEQYHGSPTKNHVIFKIEKILENIVVALTENRTLIIPLRSRQSGKEVPVTFPAATSVGARRFTSVLQILYLCHEALVSGNIITKRNVYYQNPTLFGRQQYVDRLVDDVAFTFGVGRDALNIVAASKGLIAGAQFDSGQENHGVPIPQQKHLDDINLRSTRWVLIIEKEATFRGLVASRYFETSAAGPGILVTAKGYPDLASRKFLHLLHSTYPHLPIYALVDFDPDGIAIMRTYKLGSKALDHEESGTVPGLIWLGVKSSAFFCSAASPSSLQASSQVDSQSYLSQSTNDSQHSSSQRSSSSHWNVVSPTRLTGSGRLTEKDRQGATRLLRMLDNQHHQDAEDMALTRELQVMLMMDLKFEIQAIDEAGDLMNWLDERLVSIVDWNHQ